MNTILDPTGSRPAAVYWRRRAVVFAVFSVAILLLARACGSGGPPDLSASVVQQAPVPLVSTFSPSPTATATPSPTPTASTTATPTASVTAAPTASVAATATSRPTRVTPSPAPSTDAAAIGPLSCAKSALRVQLKSDQRYYSAGEKPKLYLGVRNAGKVACLADLGSKALTLTVKSGNDRIWSSDDCQGKGTSDIRLLAPGQTLWARSVWSTVRSAPGCPKGQPKAKPGYYLLEGSAGGVEARKRAVFQLV